MADNGVIGNGTRVFLYTSDGSVPFVVRTAHELTVEGVCQQIAQHLGLSPHTSLLCGLTDCDCTFWLSPHEKFTHVAYEQISQRGLYFRVRLLLPWKKLQYVQKKDTRFMEYFYYQCRCDFLNETMENVYECRKLEREKSLGFGVLERRIFARDRSMTVKEVPRASFKSSIPDSYRKELIGTFNFWKSRRFTRDFKRSLRQDDEPHPNDKKERLWIRFILGILNSYPGYLTEKYQVWTQNDAGYGDKEDISVKPDSEIDGVGHLRNINAIRLLENQDVEGFRWIVMIFRDTQPKRILFEDKNKAESFISLLIGYYRLSVDYYLSLSKEREPPSLQKLNKHCFGPIPRSFCEKKVREKGAGAYLIRQSSTFDQLEVIFMSEGSIQTLKIECLPDNQYSLEGSYNREQNLLNLLQNDGRTAELCNPIKLRHEENFGLLLCRTSGAGEERAHLSEQPTQPVTLLLSQGEFSVNNKRLGQGYYTDVLDGSMKGETNDKRYNVAIKRLRQDNDMPKCLQFFMRMAEDFRHMRSEFIVEMKGLSLSPVPSVVLECCNLGSLVEYLTNIHCKISPTHLLQATLNVMNALKFLSTCCLKDDTSMVHGNVRCRNILVFHTPTIMDFKLADPGMVHLFNKLPKEHSCNEERLPWLAPELREDLSAMTHESDLYALGVTTWEIWSFSKRPPNDTCEEVKSLSSLPALASSSTCPEKVEEMTRHIIGLIKSCLNRDPSSRRPLPQLFPEIYPLLMSASEDAYSSEKITAGLHDSLKPGLPTPESPPSLANLFHDKGKWRFGPTASVGAESEHTETITIQRIKRPLPNVPSSNMPVEVMLPRESVKLGEKVGSGHFGQVHKGLWKMQNNEWSPCAVKTLKRDSHQAADSGLDAEMNIMIKLDHNNIVKMHGFCLSNESAPFLLVMEFVDNGSLDGILRAHNNHHLTPEMLFTICYDVAKGMKYLVSMKIVHRDLAARNVLITSNYRAKITDFGLARILGEKNYYRPENPYKSLPLSYYAPESLDTWRFDEKGDVWSYGILLWEIYTKGDQPELLVSKDVDQNTAEKCNSFYQNLKAGHRLPSPQGCPKMADDLMRKRCWEFKPEDRPAFDEIVDFLDAHKHWSDCAKRLLTKSNISEQ